jgi:hypothetical protein
MQSALGRQVDIGCEVLKPPSVTAAALRPTGPKQAHRAQKMGTYCNGMDLAQHDSEDGAPYARARLLWAGQPGALAFGAIVPGKGNMLRSVFVF